MPKYLCPKCYKIHTFKIKENKKCKECGYEHFLKRDIIKSKTQLKNKAWKVFSNYIKIKGCLKTTKTTKKGICYTCGKEYDIKDLQAGHLVSGRTNNVLFNENLVHIQCKQCNIFKHGEQGLYLIHCYDDLTKKYSANKAMKIIKKWFEPKKIDYSYDDLALIIKSYSQKIEKLY